MVERLYISFPEFYLLFTVMPLPAVPFCIRFIGCFGEIGEVLLFQYVNGLQFQPSALHEKSRMYYGTNNIS